MEVERRRALELVPGAGDDDGRFLTSLRELRDLRTQLHRAADQCESTFCNATKKKTVVENTKGYVLKAIVTVVDHLGNVASNLECSLHQTCEVSEAEQKIDCLTQRLLTSLHYSVAIDLSTVRSSIRFPRHVPHYIAPYKGTSTVRVDEMRDGVTGYEDGATQSTDSDARSRQMVIHKLIADYANAKISYEHLTLGTELSKVLPVLEGPSIHSNTSTPLSGSQAEHGRVLEKASPTKKPVLGTYISSLLRRSKKGP